jgi:hypothetical protein
MAKKRRKNGEKIAFFANKTLVLKKNVIFFAKNCLKSQKIVIITSTPDQSVLGKMSIKKWFLDTKFLLLSWVARIFLAQSTKTGTRTPNNHKPYQFAKPIPNGHKISRGYKI